MDMHVEKETDGSDNEGTATIDAKDTEFVWFYAKYRPYLEEAIILEDGDAIILEGVAAAATATEGRPSISASNKKTASNKTDYSVAQNKKRTTSIAELPPLLTNFTFADRSRPQLFGLWR
jgi:hypothetical protein